MTPFKKKVLFVGASGMVAGKIIPELIVKYDVVGIAGNREELRDLCVDFYTGDLTTEYERIFTEVFLSHNFDSIIWNPGRFFHTPLIEGTMSSLLLEFNLGVALPLECLRFASQSFGNGATFVIISSIDAIYRPKNRGSYSIIKNAQIVLAEYLAQELAERGISTKALAFGRIREIPNTVFSSVFIRAIENIDPAKILYVNKGTTWQ